jgi:hypothetical protein
MAGLYSLARTIIRSYNCTGRFRNLARITARPRNNAGRKPRNSLAVSKLQMELLTTTTVYDRVSTMLWY